MYGIKKTATSIKMSSPKLNLHVDFNSLNRDVYFELHNCNMNDVCKKYIFSYWTLYGDILYDVGKYYIGPKYCTSTFLISTLTIIILLLCGGI